MAGMKLNYLLINEEAENGIAKNEEIITEDEDGPLCVTRYIYLE